MALGVVDTRFGIGDLRVVMLAPDPAKLSSPGPLPGDLLVGPGDLHAEKLYRRCWLPEHMSTYMYSTTKNSPTDASYTVEQM